MAKNYQESQAESAKLGLEIGYKLVYAIGFELGYAQGHRRALHILLASKFGELDAAAHARVEAAGLGTLERYLDRVQPAESLAEVFAE